MSYDTHHYDNFFAFLKAYLPQGFIGIDRNDDFMRELEIVMGENDQFLYVADAIN